MPYLSDTGIHPPPTTGPTAGPPYGAFKPDHASFPGAGGTYVDPVFGTTIRRLTSTLPTGAAGQVYAKNGWMNSDGTYIVTLFPDGELYAVHTTTGAQTMLTDPGGTTRADVSFSPVDPDVFYYFVGAQLKQQLISTGVVSTVKTFGSTLGALGGSLDWIDNSGRYMLLKIGSAFRVWDKQTDTLYSGSLTGSFGGGYVAMVPDASAIILVNDAVKKSYAINHTAKTLATAGFQFYAPQNDGDHGDVICPSDGHRYFIRSNADAVPAFIERVDIQSGQIVPIYMFPADAYWTSGADHMSAVSKGVMRDWVFFDSELSGGPTENHNNFNSADPVAGWNKFENEIYAVNVLTGEVRRYAHHRSKEMAYYFHQPRVCVSWDGSRVAFASNMGTSASLPNEWYSDLYTFEVVAGGSPPPPPPPPPPPGADVVVTLKAGVTFTVIRRANDTNKEVIIRVHKTAKVTVDGQNVP